jgi:hypothetical protein
MAAPVPVSVWRVLCVLCAAGIHVACTTPPAVPDTQRIQREALEPQMNFTPRWVYLRSVNDTLARRVLWDEALYALDTWHNIGVVGYTDNSPDDVTLRPSFESLRAACGIYVPSRPTIERATSLSLQGLDSMDVFPVWKKNASGRVDSLASDKARTFRDTYRPTNGDPLVVLAPLVGYLDYADMIQPMPALGAAPGVLDRTVDGSIWLSAEPVRGDSAADKEPVPLSHEMVHLLNDVTDPSGQSPPLVRAWYKICHIFSQPLCGDNVNWIWDANLVNPQVVRPQKYEYGILTLIQTRGSSSPLPPNQCEDARALQRFLWFGTR